MGLPRSMRQCYRTHSSTSPSRTLGRDQALSPGDAKARGTQSSSFKPSRADLGCTIVELTELDLVYFTSTPDEMPTDETKPAESSSPVAREKLMAQIKSADMTEDMQQEAIEVAQEAMAKFTIERDIAQHIKRTFDERKGPTWHCIVGRNFGSYVTHETKHFIYFYLGHCAILLFKTQ
ncbi:hypothetical protein VTH06DRAFT_596 [Thermothelomyces fergusii]